MTDPTTSSPHERPDHPVIASFGAGVQSTALAFLAIRRDPRLLAVTGGRVPEAYIFADTGDEPIAVMRHLDRMREVIEASGAELIVVRHPHGVTLGDHIVSHALTGGSACNTIPFFVAGKTGGGVPTSRGCTGAWKIKPIERWIRARYGNGPRRRMPADLHLTQWLGISYDEMQRAKTSVDRWLTIEHPLIMMAWRRSACEAYLRTCAYSDGSPVEIVRSACVYCPFRSRKEWIAVKAVPEDWARALEIDDALAAGHARHGRVGGMKGTPYLHQSLRRLTDADLTDPAADQIDLWQEECAGVCGV